MPRHAPHRARRPTARAVAARPDVTVAPLVALAVLLALALAAILALPATTPAAIVVGEPAPDFSLKDTGGTEHSLAAYLADGRTVVLEWFNPDCPFVKKHHKKNRTMADTRAAFDDVVWLAINSGAPGKQGHGLARNVKAREEYRIDYPVLLDPEGEVGRAYGARTTPQMFVISPEGTVVYAGAIDDDPSVKKLGKRNHVERALAEHRAGDPVSVAKSKPYGCSVKYRTPGR